MTALFGVLYLFFIIAIVIASGFVVWHLLRYSMDQKLALTTVILFLVIGGILLLINVSFFVNIPFSDLFASSPTSSQSFGL